MFRELGGTCGVVEKKHHCGGPPSPLLAPEEHLPDVTDITNLGMTETELPQDQRPEKMSELTQKDTVVATPGRIQTHVYKTIRATTAVKMSLTTKH